MSKEGGAAPGAVCFDDFRAVLAWACSVRRTLNELGPKTYGVDGVAMTYADVDDGCTITRTATYRSPSALLMHSHRTAMAQPLAGHFASLRIIIIACCHLVDWAPASWHPHLSRAASGAPDAPRSSWPGMETLLCSLFWRSALRDSLRARCLLRSSSR